MGRLTTIFFIGLLTSLLTIIIPVSIGKFYDLEFNFNSHRSQILKFLPDSWLNSISGFMIFFTVLVILKFVSFTFYRVYFRNLGEKFIKYTKDKLFDHQLYVQHNIYSEKGTSKYLLRYSGDINSLKRLFISGTLSVLIDGTISVIGFIWLFYLNFKGGIVLLLGSLIAFLIIMLINKKIEYHSLKKRNLTSGQLSFVNRSFKAVLSVISFNKQPTEIAKYQKRTNRILNEAISFIKWDALNRGFISFFQYGLLIPVFYLFHQDNSVAVETITSGGSLVSFILLYITILPILRRLFRLPTVYKLGFISLNKLNDIISLPQEEGSNNKLIVSNPRLEFIDFSINNSTGFSFRSKKNKTTNLRIPEGLSPKDIIKAILRISDDYEGSILINKEDIKTFDPISIRKNIAVASESFPFIGRSVLEAISYSRDSRSIQRSKKCLQQIYTSFELNQRLYTRSYIGENGDQLSSMGKEIIALARALNQRKKIIIVDHFPRLSKLNRSIFKQLLLETGATVIILR